MRINGYHFLLTEEKHRFLTLAEHEGLCCLRDRARRYGGAGDVLYVCLSGCSLLVQFVPDEAGVLQATGFAFRKEHEPWLWVWLPVLVAAASGMTKVKKDISIDEALIDQLAELEQKRPSALLAGAQAFEHAVGRQMKPYSVGFTRIASELYGDDGIRWYPIQTDSAPATAEVETIPAEQVKDCQPSYQAEDGAYVAPPRLFGSWRVTRGGEKAKLGAVEETTDWYAFAQRVRSALKDL
ncbi:MAG: hypothetical protein Q4P20_08410 [Eubacteriales bacterium]|nr:hypothetical protein [Eubacteriales bacterium]